MLNTLINILKKVFWREITNVHTTTVARITKVNESTVNCQPVINRVTAEGDFPLPEFAEVPVITLQGGGLYENYPIKEGDYCILFVTERPIDRWWKGQDNMRPPSTRMFDYSDAFALVGVNPEAAGFRIPPENITRMGNTDHTGDLYHLGSTAQVGGYHLRGDQLIDGNLTINGDLTVNGNITCSGICAAPTIATGSIVPFPGTAVTPSIDRIVVNESIIAGGVEHIGHRHDYTTAEGGGTTGTPK